MTLTPILTLTLTLTLLKDPTLALPCGVLRFEVECSCQVTAPAEQYCYNVPGVNEVVMVGQCAICTEELSEEAPGCSYVGCGPGHAFHSHCAALHWARRPQCPVCRNWSAKFHGDMPSGRFQLWP